MDLDIVPIFFLSLYFVIQNFQMIIYLYLDFPSAL